MKPVYVNPTLYMLEALVFPHAKLKYGLPPKFQDIVMQRGYNSLLLFAQRCALSCGTSYRRTGTLRLYNSPFQSTFVVPAGHVA